MDSEADYDALAALLTDPDAPVRSAGKALHGAAAAAAGREFLLREYGSEEELRAALRPGRPRIGAPSASGESPTVRGRISERDYAAFKTLESKTGKKQSELVREAIHLLLVENKLAS
ncbi:ribbon-helix-helix domain-containing protein [Subtercola endophyticus]|uniref:hypothetical protein n=1 Tax=Subtercola endophyticus TaxID=2895559 RepID=UPI001E3506B6|nr:hypothetical protein [Subtercola endophyticus]UFS59697.1 hypothetical protein LQ955_02535 [Subtercola endophyticus]